MIVLIPVYEKQCDKRIGLKITHVDNGTFLQKQNWRNIISKNL